MSEKYISASKLKAHYSWLGKDATLSPKDVDDIVDAQPAADVEPVVRGEWKRMKLEGDMAIYSKCSVCGYVYNGSTFLVNYMKSIVEREHNYCPNCGAHMSVERSGSGE